jgi:glycosyltransferase involved in cell wall biosynthesis
MNDGGVGLSFYVLTHDSAEHLEAILSRVRRVADELIVVDSGSADATPEIARAAGARLIHRPFDSFREQRTFALAQCAHNWVLNLDSDEVPDDALVQSLARLKAAGFRPDGQDLDGFRLRRQWYVLGRRVHAFYPISSPDHPLRLFRRDRVSFAGSSRVHESPSGYTATRLVAPGELTHWSVASPADLARKLDLYTSLAARDLGGRRGSASRSVALLHALAALYKWYVVKRGWMDGRVGWALGRYAFDYTLLKYRKLSAGSDTAPVGDRSGGPPP